MRIATVPISTQHYQEPTLRVDMLPEEACQKTAVIANQPALHYGMIATGDH